MEIIIIILILIGIFLIAYSLSKQNDFNLSKLILFKISGLSYLILSFFIFVKLNKQNSFTQVKYKVMELENRTVFVITDDNEGYIPLKEGLLLNKYPDTIWVNMDKKIIDPVDSTAMMCVIIEKLK